MTISMRPLPTLAAAIIALLLMGMVYSAIALNPSRHAVTKHEWTAVEIVECIANQGPYMNMAFRSKDGKFYIPCQMHDGKIGMGIFDSDGNNISAYVPRDGLWEQVRDYILQRAFRYKGPLPF